MRRAGKAPSIKDVAALAKVSVPTVSRYLNAPERVSEGKRETIARAIQVLGYRPNAIARALVREQSHACAILTTNTVLYGQSQTIQGIEFAARDSGYSLTIGVLAQDGRDGLKHSVDAVLDHNPAGVALLDFDEFGDQVLSMLPVGLPKVVVAGERRSDVAQISMSEREGGRLITEHLLSCGARDVRMVGIPGGGGANGRVDGWREACEAAGLPTHAPLESGWDSDSARSVGRTLGRDPQVQAVFAGNDETAMGVIRGLNDEGRRVPQDVIVAGFDDHPIARIWNPSLTTIRQDFQSAGRQAFAMLLPMIEDVAAGREHGESWTAFRRLEGELIVRESTGMSSQSD